MQQLRISQAVKFFTEPMQKCFCTLRLRPHDGFPNIIAEFGLMGRPAIYNDSIVPNCHAWNSGSDILYHIQSLYGKRLSLDVNKIHDDMNEYLKKGERL